MPGTTNAVFLSYASEDTDAAERIAAALRSAGIEVWFDKSELRGGDAWDGQIRDQIQHCRLFIAVISGHTEARDEGYFRREWRLAVERAGDMHQKKAFLIPVVIDDTSERGAAVPDKFRELQWTRLPGGATPSAFIGRVQRLLSPEPPPTGATVVDAGISGTLAPTPAVRGARRALLAVIAVAVVGAAAYFAYLRPWAPRRAATSPSPPAAAAGTKPSAFNPPPHSIAVLPFENMSGDKEQDYFSEGLAEELLNDLSRFQELQVAARTSAFAFKGKDADIGTIARKLNVGAILEGSVRRSAHQVRITTQLINAVTGFHIWSQTYDRNLGDILKLQTEIAEAVASALKVTLLDDAGTRMEVGGTQSPAAYDAYLRALNTYWHAQDGSDIKRAIAGYAEAARLDPGFALAFAGWSIALTSDSDGYGDPRLALAREPALKAIALAPNLAEGHLALAIFLDNSFEFRRAEMEYGRALALAPGNARVLKDYGEFTVRMGHTDAGLPAARRSVVLDPSNVGWLGAVLQWARRYDESARAYRESLAYAPDDSAALIGLIALDYYRGAFQQVRTACDGKPRKISEADCQLLLAMANHKLGRDADAAAALRRLLVLRSPDVSQYELAQVYAQWGEIPKALERLEVALHDHEPDLRFLKVDPILDPLRNEPRFQAVLKTLDFPD